MNWLTDLLNRIRGKPKRQMLKPLVKEDTSPKGALAPYLRPVGELAKPWYGKPVPAPTKQLPELGGTTGLSYIRHLGQLLTGPTEKAEEKVPAGLERLPTPERQPVPESFSPTNLPTPEEVWEAAKGTDEEHELRMYRQTEGELREVESWKYPEGTPMPKHAYYQSVWRAFPPNEVSNALLIMMHESGADPKAVNENRDKDSGRVTSIDYGLFQINDVHEQRIREMFGVPRDVSKEEVMELMLDPIKNVQVARDIFLEQGWGPWVQKSVLRLRK